MLSNLASHMVGSTQAGAVCFNWTGSTTGAHRALGLAPTSFVLCPVLIHHHSLRVPTSFCTYGSFNPPTTA